MIISASGKCRKREPKFVVHNLRASEKSCLVLFHLTLELGWPRRKLTIIEVTYLIIEEFVHTHEQISNYPDVLRLLLNLPIYLFIFLFIRTTIYIVQLLSSSFFDCLLKSQQF